MKKWKNETIQNILQNFAVATGHTIVGVTQQIDKALPPTDLSRWMDTINSTSGGWYHRVKHGHDFAANLGDVYDKFGIKGVLEFPFQIARDSTTPHGVPLPGTQVLVNQGAVGAKAATEWLSLNVGEVFSGGVALYSTYKLYKKAKSGEIDEKTVIWATVGLGIKISAGVITTNPVLLISGAADLTILITSKQDAKKAFKTFLGYIVSDKAFVGYVALASGAGAAASTASVVSAVGVASTGTAISTLSGAAASNALLAAIGGGSLATGGLGVAGGIVILSGGSAVVGLAAGYSVYKYLNKRKLKITS